jgi:hypothetical protein
MEKLMDFFLLTAFTSACCSTRPSRHGYEVFTVIKRALLTGTEDLIPSSLDAYNNKFPSQRVAKHNVHQQVDASENNT